jgi:hypothetical protein
VVTNQRLVVTGNAPMLFVHHVTDGRPPAVPLPQGLLERARQQGRLG